MSVRSRGGVLHVSPPKATFGWVCLLVVALNGCQRQDEAPPEPPRSQARRPARFPSHPVPPQAREIPAGPVTAEETAPSKLRTYELKLEPKDLSALERNAFSNQTIPATFICEGKVYEGVQVRYRGAWARTWPKKPLKIFFDKAKPFEDERTLNLNSGWRDPALARELFAYHVFAACGVPSPKSRLVRLHINGRFRGVYVQVQQPDKRFVAAHQLKGASIYKAVSRRNQADERDLGSEAVFRQHYEKQTRKDEGYQELQTFCHALATSTNSLEFFNTYVDLEEYVNFLVATVLTQNWDGFNKNHYLIYDGQGSKKWSVVPWDLDRTFGDHWNWSFDEAELPILLGTRALPGVTGWNRMQEQFFSEPTLRAQFVKRLEELLATQFTEEKLFPVIDRVAAELGPDAALDRHRWPAPAPELGEAIEQVKRYVQHRRAFLLRELGTLR